MSPVHALEQLRYVARGWAVGDEFPVQEVAAVLAELADENPASVLQACRRLIEYFPATGRVWWLSARALSAADAVEGIWEAADELARDPTGRHLADSLSDRGAIAVIAPSRSVVAALRRRPDLVLRKKARGADLVVVPALAAGPAAVLVGERVGAVAANARRAGQVLWVVAERGVVLPEPLWAQLRDRALGSGPEGAAGAAGAAGGTARTGGAARTAGVAGGAARAAGVAGGAAGAAGAAGGVVVLASTDVGLLVGEKGPAPAAEVLSTPTCPPVAELLGWKS